MGSVLIVRADRLAETPKAFRDYVAKFFVEDTVLGIKVFKAQRVLHWNHHDWELLETYHRRGRAPCHSVELMDYKDGLPEGQSLNDWIRKAPNDLLFEAITEDPPSNCVDED